MKVNFSFVIIPIINKSKLPSTSGGACLYDSRLPSAGQMQEPPQVKIGVRLIKLLSKIHSVARRNTVFPIYKYIKRIDL